MYSRFQLQETRAAKRPQAGSPKDIAFWLEKPLQVIFLNVVVF